MPAGTVQCSRIGCATTAAISGSASSSSSWSRSTQDDNGQANTGTVGDVTESGRWPVYAAAVVERAGVGAVFALPLQWATINLGVLDLHRKAAGSLPPAQLRDVLGAADIAALMLLGLRTDPGEDRVWERSWGNRVEIHQATGMVLAQLDLSATDAFARLRAYAFLEHRLLGDVARDVVARRLRFTQDT